MRTYQLFLIEDEFANFYFGREYMFFQLFKEHKEANVKNKPILEKQIEYITKSIPAIRLHQYLEQQLPYVKNLFVNNGKYIINYGKKSGAELSIFDRYLILRSEGSYEGETTFFEILRKNERLFFAVDIENERYGWLKPIKERKFV